MFEQQKLKSDHKDQIDETSGRAKGLLDNAKLLVEDLKMKVDLEMKVGKEVDTKKDITEDTVDSARRCYHTIFAFLSMHHVGMCELSNKQVRAWVKDTVKHPENVMQKLEEAAMEPYMKCIRQIQRDAEIAGWFRLSAGWFRGQPLPVASTSEPQSLASPALKPEEDFIVRTVFSKSEKVKTEDKKEEASLVFLSWVKTDRQETCSTQAFPNNLQQIFDTSDEEKARGLDWKKECRLLYWQEKLKEAKAKLKILTIVKMIAVHQVN